MNEATKETEVELEWPASLSEKARSVLARKFCVGQVRAGDEGDQDVVGARAFDFEASARIPVESLLQSSVVQINEWAERGLLVGTRRSPHLRLQQSRDGWIIIIDCRLMFAPGKKPTP